MEIHPIRPDGDNPSPRSTSPYSCSSSSGGGGSRNNGSPPAAAAVPASLAPPVTPKSIPRTIETAPYPTTFVQADTSSFKQVVQMLTGSSETAAKHSAPPPPPSPPVTAKNTPPLPPPPPPAVRATAPKKPAFKLYERRSSYKNLKMISPLVPTFLAPHHSGSPLGGGGGPAAFSPRKQPDILSPSTLDFPSLVLSPVTPLIPDPFNRSPKLNLSSSSSSSSSAAVSEEERVIAEKGFYLHPSPRGSEPPRLLPLFPVTSPRVSSASAAGSSP